MPTINAQGVNFYYELYGHGKPLVLIAGYTGTHSFWRFMVDKLATQFKVLVFDNRAIGQTKDDGKPFTLDMMAEDTIALVEQLGLVKPHIIGQSMGGAIAQIIAKKHANRIDKLILLNTAAKLNVRTCKVLESILNLRKADTEFNIFIDAALPWFFSSEYLSDPNNITAFKEDLLHDPFPQSISDQERQLQALAAFDSRQWSRDILLPTLVVSASEDIIALPEESKNLAKGIAKSKFKTIPGAHSSPVEQHNVVNEVVMKFLL
jgi:pimeloyl-ACP methyl ester carboxylesterase